MKNILKLSLSISLIGILLLLSLSNILQPKLIQIEQLNNKLVNKNIKIQGEIFNINTYEKINFQVIFIKDSTGTVEVTVDKILNLTNHQNITVIGKVKTYEKDLQIQADKIII